MVVILDTDPKSDVCPRSVCRPVASQVVPSTSLDCNLIASGVFCNSIRMNNLRVSVARFAEIYFPIGQSFTHDRPQEAQWCVRPEARDEAFFGVRCYSPIWTARAAPRLVRSANHRRFHRDKGGDCQQAPWRTPGSIAGHDGKQHHRRNMDRSGVLAALRTQDLGTAIRTS
jgi:hypothetical protein